MEREPKTIQEREEKIARDLKTAIKNGIHADVAVNPFLSEEARARILEGKMQDPEWD